MTTNSLSPRLLKGAIITLNLPQPTPTVIPFQYNPTTLSRTLTAQAAESGSAPAEALRLKGAPTETIKLDIELDATDYLETPSSKEGKIAIKHGIHPQLAALETLLYPPSRQVLTNETLLNLGTITLSPPAAPFTLFVWGNKRMLPVRITDYSVTEDAFDVNLNPIRAKISLGLQVLSYNDLPWTHLGYHKFLAHQIIKETQAKIAQTNQLNPPSL